MNEQYGACSCLLSLVTHDGEEGEKGNLAMHLAGSAIPYVMYVWEQFLCDRGEDWLMSWRAGFRSLLSLFSKLQ